MNKFKSGIAIVAGVTAIAILSGCQQDGSSLTRAADVPSTDDQKQSYSLGQSMGGSLKAADITVDSAYFNAGFYDAMDGEKRMTQEEIQASLAALQQATQLAQAEKRNSAMQASLDASAASLADNAAQEGITVTESGLQYKVLTVGDGAMPTAEDTVTVHYEGRLFDGTVFDSSLERGEPATFPVGGVIAGWTEALQLMPVGSKWQLFIPADLAYGENGAGNVIQPNSALVFDVELLAIQDDAPAAE
jgi:FKBP-type peptidyl-prolyl cis-trans isomerase FklB|tara:strand:- start:531 stop:1271 length:741 start_codon:yes stop_codon:yes gene_type:complete